MSIPDGDIPEDALVEILVRLPVKSLLKFRCVSKSWYSLISNPQFISTHTRFTYSRPKKPDRLLFGRKLSMSHVSFSLRFDDQSFSEDRELSFRVEVSSNVQVIGYCHGLICLSRSDVRSQVKAFVVWNPTLGISVVLPEPSFKTPCDTDYLHGFGYDAKRNDYKVIRIRYEGRALCPSEVPRQCEVFELSRNAWKVVSPGASLPYICPGPSPVFINGFVHWIGGLRTRSIVAFDCVDEAFHEMNLPGELKNVDFNRLGSLVKERSYLSALCCDLRTENLLPHLTLSIWVMKEYGVEESWSKLFNIHYPDFRDFLRPVGIRTNGELLGITRDNVLVSYDGCTSSVTCLGYYGGGRPIGFSVDHTETLVLLQVRGAEMRQ